MDKNISYYDKNAMSYFYNTKYLDMKEAYDRFLSRVVSGGLILDFGCGGGRDSKYFLSRNYKVSAIDGSKEMCRLASEYAKIYVKNIEYKDFNDTSIYDGIWANASLVHLDDNNLLSTLSSIREALKDDGVFYMSLKNNKSERESDRDRIFYYRSFDEVYSMIRYLDFELEEYYNSVNKRNIVWDNYILKKEM